MKSHRFVGTIMVISALHFSIWWACAGYLKLTGFELFTLPSLFGFGAPPRHTTLQEMVFILQGIMTYPVASLPFWGEGLVPDVFILAVNSLAWGLCVAFTIWAVCRERSWLALRRMLKS